MEEQKFTDEQVTRACGLHIDNLRRLITWGAVRPVQAGGGRGRVRLWTFAQAMRIAVTAEFFEAGFSLQMAHTLTYCLPFDDFLHIYDPHFLAQHLNRNRRNRYDDYLRAMLDRDAKDTYWPPADAVGSEIVFVNRRFLFADLMGDTGFPFGIIDAERNLFYPTRDPTQIYWGVVTAGAGKRSSDEPAIKGVDPHSLLIDPAYFSSRKRERERVLKQLPEIRMILDFEKECFYRNLLKINMNVGLVMAFRKLLGFPVADPFIGEE